MKSTRQPSAFVSRQVESSRLFYLEDVQKEGFAVVFGGFERCRTDYRIDRRSFPWYCLEFVDRGHGTLHLGQGVHELGPGSFYLYGPGQAHRIVSSAEHPLRKYFVGFAGSEVSRFLELHDMVPGVVARCIKGDVVRHAFDILIDRGVRKSTHAGYLCELATRQLIVMCRDDSAGMVNVDSPAFLTYARARDVIEDRHAELTTLEAVADVCGIDSAYLCRLFARYHDESPYQYLTRLRMDHASRLLLDGAASVKSVATAMGFKDAFHFSRVFKSVHHVPPSRFRQAMEGK